MMRWHKMNRVFLVAVAVLAAGTAQAVTVDLVRVGNPGNDPDTRYKTPGVGSVAEPYLIGKYEVTAGQYTQFLNAVAADDTYGLYRSDMSIEQSGSAGSYTYSVAGDWANRPVFYVSWGDAARFANWLHNEQPTGGQDLTTTEDGAYYLNGATSRSALGAVTRENDATWFIPTEHEWYKAAYHKNDGVTGNYFDYPTGSDEEPSNDLIDPDPGNNANFVIPEGDFAIGDPYWWSEVGEFENSESPYGTFDQGGNVTEWNETAGPALSRGLRGAHWYSNSSEMRASSGRYDYPTYERFSIGFRVASVPEPGSITLFVCGLLVGVIWWRRQT